MDWWLKGVIALVILNAVLFLLLYTRPDKED